VSVPAANPTLWYKGRGGPRPGSKWLGRAASLRSRRPRVVGSVPRKSSSPPWLFLDAVHTASVGHVSDSTISVGSSPAPTPTTRNVASRRIGIVSPTRMLGTAGVIAGGRRPVCLLQLAGEHPASSSRPLDGSSSLSGPCPFIQTRARRRSTREPRGRRRAGEAGRGCCAWRRSFAVCLLDG
jgi:hypothetical protein